MVRTFLKSLFGNWSLERKCLLFLGLALLVSLVLGFFAVQFVAERLVIEATRQTARDSANALVGLKHVSLSRLESNGQGSTQPDPKQIENEKIDQKIRETFWLPRFEFEILRLDDGLNHFMLDDPIALDDDHARLTKIRAKLAEKDRVASELAATIAQRSASISAPSDPAGNPPATAPSTPTPTPVSSSPLASLANPTEHIFDEKGPVDGNYYVYYHPIQFDRYCMKCHIKLDSSSNLNTTPAIDPFRVVRVRMPYGETIVLRIWSYSLLSSIGIATLALSLLFIHWILKRLVINPLSELKSVSEEITSGNTDRQFRVDTDDEFSELSDSFNRMLRHWTETQKELEEVNEDRVRQVDDLARLNLQLFEANRLKGEFLANMSHELRTPLNSILGFSEVLSGIETLTDKQRRWVSNIQNSGRILLEMINDILDLAKVEAGKMEVRPTEFNLLTVVEAQVEIFRKMAEDKNIDIQVDSNQESMPVYQDQSKLAQIMTNLLSNAIKFTPEGGLVTIACDWDGEQAFFVSVADTGVGIAPHEHEVIFEKFRQAASVGGQDSLTREHSGTGLGLSIVRELCRLLGGDISLSSQLGQGSTFRFVLPSRYQPVEPQASFELAPPRS